MPDGAHAGSPCAGALLKACTLLGHFAAGRPARAPNDLTTRGGVDKATVYRLMPTLIRAEGGSRRRRCPADHDRSARDHRPGRRRCGRVRRTPRPIEEAGSSLSDSGHLPGVATVAAPMLGRDGSVVALVGVGGRSRSSTVTR
ncbi:helix-turn-helix domain-containing protein [Nocardia sp. NPDC003963]